jgi:MraZ protein
MFLAGASAETPDKQGRVTVPPPLRTYAGLDRDCAVIGVGARCEIWDSAGLGALLAEQEESFADLSRRFLPGLL